MGDKFKENQEKLRKLFIEMFPKLAEEGKDEKLAGDEVVAKLLEENKGMKERMEALEKMKGKEVSLIVPGETKVTTTALYKGYDLRNQGAELAIKDNTVKEEIAKFFIDFLEKFRNFGMAKAAMNETTAAQGGYTVFPEYINQLLGFARLQSVTLQECRVIDVSTDSIHIPTEDASVSVSWKAEATALAASDPTFKELNLTPYKLGAYSTASNELLEDSAFDIVSWLTTLYAESIAREIDSQVFNGSQFTGIFGASGINEVQTTTNTVAGLDWKVLSNAISQLSTNKLPNAKFYFNRQLFHYVRIMVDGAGNAIWSPASGGDPAKIWEFPYKLIEDMPSDSTAGAYIGLLGDLKHYIIARRKGNVTLEADQFGKFLEYQTRFRAVTRWDGAPWNAAAFVQIVV